MNNKEFAEKAKEVATKYKTLYILGCFGSPMNSNNKNRYTKNYPYNAQSIRKNKIMNCSSDTFGFDCVCLIKGILWGWNGNINMTYGGAKYESNNVPDIGADQMINFCNNVSTDFSNIEIGEILHMKGHVGIYIGDGLAVECTPIWKDGVQITAVSGKYSPSEYTNVRKWERHGRLKFINYVSSLDNVKKTIEEIAHEVIDGKWDNGYGRKVRLKNAGYDYQTVQKRVNEILANMTPNIEYYPIPKYKGVSIVDALKSIGVDSSLKYRTLIAKANGIYSYTGTPMQNSNMLKLLKVGKLKKA